MGRIHRYRTALSRHHRSGGFGIHSPFAFNFVCNVLSERLPYYNYSYIEELRRSVATATGQQFLRRDLISGADAKMLFRIVNFFNPQHVLQVGTKNGITAVSMLLVSTKSQLYLYEPKIVDCTVVKKVFAPFEDRISCFDDATALIEAFKETIAIVEEQPFVLVNEILEEDFETVKSFLLSILKDCGVIVLRNLNRNKLMKYVFETCKRQMTHGQTYTNEKVAVIISSPKLQQEHFFLWF